MKQSSLGLSNTVKRPRKREFLDAMELVVPWAELVAQIEPYAPVKSFPNTSAILGNHLEAASAATTPHHNPRRLAV